MSSLVLITGLGQANPRQSSVFPGMVVAFSSLVIAWVIGYLTVTENW